jgi:hypothetical protein
MGEEYSTYGRAVKCTHFFSDKHERDHFQDLVVDGEVILNLYQRNSVSGCELDLSGSGSSPVVGFCEQDDEHFISIKDEY